MAWGITGVHCLDCNAEWNYRWHTEREPGELVICPNCESEKVAVYSQLVPFAVGGGHPPDYVYHCICGSVFQHPPKVGKISPYETDLSKLAKLVEVTCPFCQRSNKPSWYIPGK